MAGANPFLSDADFTDYGNTEADVAVSHMNINSNPFLTGSDYNISEGGSENPFLSGATDGAGNEDGSFLVDGGGGGTNPFASDFTDEASEVDFFGVGTTGNEPEPSASAANSAASSAFQDIFSNVVAEEPPASAPSPIVPTSVAPPIAVHAQNPPAPGRPPPPHPPHPPPPRPPPAAAQFPPSRPPVPAHDIFGADIPAAPAPKMQEAPMMDLLGGEEEDDEATSAETSQIMSRQEEMHAAEQQASHPAQHAPGRPPPPRPAPPSKETQELILSVTGAMEATSSHLLDRLRATKTPSPTPIRELHSPSPSPDPTASFLMSDEPTSADLMLGEGGPDEEDTTQRERTPSPQPQASSFAPVEAASTNDDFLDIFGNGGGGVTSVETAPLAQHPPPKPPPPHPAPPTSNADLLGLFGAQPTPVTVVAPTEEVTVVTSAADSLFSSVTTSTPPAPSSADLLMGDFGEPEAEAQPQPAQQAAMPEEGNFLAGPPEEPQPVIQETTPAAPVDGGFGSISGGGGDSDFDAFAAKFESAAKDDEESRGVEGGDPFDPFASGGGSGGGGGGGDAWGSTAVTDGGGGGGTGFGGDDDQFDAFLSMSEPLAPAPTPIPATTMPMPTTKMSRRESADSDDGGPDFSIFIKPKTQEEGAGDFDASGMGGILPTLAPPPKSPVNAAYSEPSAASRFNPFDKSGLAADATGVPPAGSVAPTTLGLESNQGQAIGIGAVLPGATGEPGLTRTDSQETPPTPLFDEDVSQPLEEFPRTIHDENDGWEMQLRQPNKKKITGQRFWKKVYVKLVIQGDNPVLQLYNTKDDKDPFQELPLQPCYSISDISAQQYDAYGKIFTVKLQYVFYKERPGVRPGQVTKAERITNKLSQFAAYAIQGDYQGVKEFGSDLKKLGLPVEHAPQISQLLKLGSQSYEDLKKFSVVIEEALFRLSAHRDRALNYKSDEVQITAVDELYVEQNYEGHVTRQIARVRVFFLGFITGMPDIELGVNDMVRQGKEVVGRHDIIPVVTEEWIRLENVEFHSCVETSEYETTRVIKFKPPDACYIELMRFRIRPPKNRELPLQLKVTTCTTGNKIEIKGDILVPGFASRKLGQVPCEDIAVRIPIPECWIYLFRVEKHFRYGSVKSAHRRTGKIKGIERLLGTMETMDQSLIEVTSGQAKYEHQHRAIVWRMSRLPKEGQGAYTTHQFVCRLALTSFDQMPEKLDQYAYVEFTMPATQASHTTIRSVSVSGGDNDPPEKYVRYLARHEYRVEIEHTQGSGPGAYVTATLTTPKAPEPVEEEKVEEGSGKDSDSDSSS